MYESLTVALRALRRMEKEGFNEPKYHEELDEIEEGMCQVDERAMDGATMENYNGELHRMPALIDMFETMRECLAFVKPERSGFARVRLMRVGAAVRRLAKKVAEEDSA